MLWIKSVFLFQVCFFCILHSASAQDAGIQTISENCSAFLTELENEIQRRILKHSAERSGVHKASLQDFDEALSGELKDRFSSHEFICDTNIVYLTTQFVREIQKANSERFHVDFITLISKEPSVNAQSIGHQVIIIHAGLLSAVKTKDELLFVIAHEMAHDYLRHREKMLVKIAEAISKTSNKELKSFINKKSAKREALIDYFTSLELSAKAFSRKQELEADSLAYLLTQKLTGRKSLAVMAIKNLLAINENELSKKWRDELAFPAFPFQSYWDYVAPPIVPPDTLSHDKIALFSTHPNIEDRLLRLEFLNADNPDSVCVPFQINDSLRQRIFMESIDLLYRRHQLDIALFEAFKVHNAEKPNEDVCIWIGRIFNRLSELRSQHKFEEYIPRTPYPVISSHDQLILVLNNMRVKDLAKVGYYFLDQYQFHSSTYEEIKKSLYEKI